MDKSPKQVYQFKISLLDIQPKIWRMIQVPREYSFWDLHVAIQNAMGWTDSHLHQFKIIDPKNDKETYIGYPNDECFAGELPTTNPGWKEFICNYFSEGTHDCCCYEYDFGDGWEHEIRLEKILPATPGCRYPICLAGERACPPEDCGGIGGYENFLEIIMDPKHEEHKSMLEWVGGKFHPEKFEASKVRFENPKQRLKCVLGSY